MNKNLIKLNQEAEKLLLNNIELQKSSDSNAVIKLNPDCNQDINKDLVYKEGGWGWVVVIASGYCFGILIGMINNYALIYNEFDKVYNGTENHIVYSAWIGSASTGIQYIFCAFTSVLTDFFGPRKTGILGGLISTLALAFSILITDIKIYFLSYGFLYGLGQAFLLSSTLAILPHYFNKRLSFANGVMNFIGAIIVVLLPISSNIILNKFSLKGIFLFLSILNFVTILMTLTYKPIILKNKFKNKMDRIKESFGLKVFKKKKFLIWCVASSIGMIGYLIPIVNISHHSIKAFPEYDPVYVNIIFGLASGLGALLFGIIGDMTKFNRIHYHTLVFLTFGIIQYIIPITESFSMFLIQMAILGLMDGVLLCFIVPISFDLTKSSKLSNQASGYYHLAISLPSVTGPVIAGLIYEKFKSYEFGFYIGGTTCLLGAIILIVFIFGLELIKKKKLTSVEKKIHRMDLELKI